MLAVFSLQQIILKYVLSWDSYTCADVFEVSDQACLQEGREERGKEKQKSKD